MSDARTHVMNNIRAALDRGRAEMARRGIQAPTRPEDRTPEELGAPTGLDSVAARADRFQQTLEGVGGHVTRCADEAEAARALREIVGEAACVAVSDHELATRIADVGLADVPERFTATSPRADHLRCDFGVTCAQHAIAETGTLVLGSSREQNRILSLVPNRHVAILRAEDIVPDLRDALAAIQDEPAATFITGPSRTGDIELTLAIGVHGPKELFVLLLDPRD